MRSKDLPFRAVKPEFMSTRTRLDLIDWIEDYVQVLFPQGGMEYWSNGSFSGTGPVIGEVIKELRTHGRPLIYATAGYGGEANRIEIGIRAGKRAEVLAWGKHFGLMDEAWAIARALYFPMYLALEHGEEPLLVDMLRHLPKGHSRVARSENNGLVGSIVMTVTTETINVADSGGASITDFINSPLAFGCSVAEFIDDWRLVAKSIDVPLSVVSEEQVTNV